MKKFLFGFVIIQAIVVGFGLFVYLDIFQFSKLDRQTFSILMNTKEILLVTLYIAWRVTPSDT